MNPQTIALLLQLVTVVGQLAPGIIQAVETIKAQEGKTADQIFQEAGVTIAANDAKALAILADLMTPPAQ